MSVNKINRPIISREVATASTTINPNGTAWIQYAIPSGYSCVGIGGYSIEGTGNTVCQFYALQNTGYVAVRNTSASVTANITIKLYLLLIPQ